MFRRKLCPRCKIGELTYQMDPRSPVCPYLCCHNGKKCSMYVKLEKTKKTCFLKKLLLRALKKRRKNAPFHQKN